MRDAIAVRCGEMEASCPEALDLAAQALEELRVRLTGRATALAGTRGAKYRREQLRGERTLALEDLAWLAREVPGAVATALDRLIRPAGYRVVVEDVAGVGSGHHSQGSLVEALAAVDAALTRAMEDHRMDDADATEMDRAAEWLEWRVGWLGRAIDLRRRPQP